MPEVRVTIDENLDSFLNKIVASGLYPSKAELNLQISFCQQLEFFRICQSWET